MFKLNENYELDRKILKCDNIRYSTTETSTLKTPNSQLYVNKSREHSVVSVLNSYLDLNFEVIRTTDISRYANGNDIQLVNRGLIVSLSVFNLTTSSGKHYECISQAHIVFVSNGLITSSRGSHHLSIGFDRDRGRRQQELTNNKNIKGIFHVSNMLQSVFDYAEHKEKSYIRLRL